MEQSLTKETPAVFPELPFFLNSLYARVRNLNGGKEGDMEDLRPRPAIEAGIKFTF